MSEASPILNANTINMGSIARPVFSSKRKPSATPVTAECARESLKNAIPRSVTNTPRRAQVGPRMQAEMSA